MHKTNMVEVIEKWKIKRFSFVLKETSIHHNFFASFTRATNDGTREGESAAN